jgi:hypothetical protein
VGTLSAHLTPDKSEGARAQPVRQRSTEAEASMLLTIIIAGTLSRSGGEMDDAY